MIFYLTIVFLFMSLPANAWGPATHLEYADQALGSLSLFAPIVKKLISRFKNHFFYGVVAADITLGKNLRGYLYNCHNWKVALDLLDSRAQKDSQKAFMYGYLGHLAADTVAHNFFVPYKLIRSWDTKLLNHVYWEMRFDLSVPDQYWNMMGQFKDSCYLEDDEVLEGYLKRTFFSFKTNKKIFDGLIVLQRMQQYKTMAQKYASFSAWQIRQDDVEMYKKLAITAMINFFKKQEHSFCLQADPTGKLKFLYARDCIRQLRILKRSKKIDAPLETRILSDIKQKLAEGIYEPVTMPVVLNY